MQNQPQAVLRYRDGRALRVTLTSIDASQNTVEAVDEAGSATTVPFGELKAVFFPRDSHAAEPPPATGSTLTIEFSDGEVIRGLATYNPERNGFFLFPLDRSKNDRIFVVNSAIVGLEVEKL